MKIIKVSEQTYNRIISDQAHFEKTIGINFNINQVIQEYQKILDSMVD